MSTTDPEAPPPPAPAQPGSHWSAGRVIAMVLASLAGLLGLCLLLGGAAILVAHGVVRDSDGFYESATERFQSSTYAITTDEIDLDIGPADWAGEDLLGTLRIEVESAGDRSVFVGIAPDAAVERYLTGVRHDVLADFDGRRPDLEQQPGNRTPRPPGAQGFWEASTEGSGEQRFDWKVESGIWSTVVMNADGSPGIDVEAEVGVKLGWLVWVGLGLLIAGLVLTAAAVILIVVISRRASHGPAPTPGTAA